MSGVQITYDINNAALLDHVRRLAMHGDTAVNKGVRAIGVYMIGEVEKHFDDQTLWDDSAMPTSAAATARSGKTLIEHHNLYDSYHPEYGSDEVSIGSDLIYAAIHHAGGMAGRGHKTKIEARPVLGVNPRNEADILDELAALLVGLE